MIYISGEIVGDGKEVRELLAAAPNAFLKSIRRWMYQERNRYMGNEKDNGKFRKKLLRKRLAGKGGYLRKGTWSEGVVKGFKGYVYNKKSLDNISLKMGIGLNNPSKFTLGLRKMDAGYNGSRTINSGSTQMPVPVSRNIRKIYTGRQGSAFEDLSREKKLVPINKNGRTLWFGKDQVYKTRGRKGKFKKNTALMFIGAKSVKLRPQFDFTNMLEGDKSKMVNRARRSVRDTTRRLSRGIVRKSDFKDA